MGYEDEKRVIDWLDAGHGDKLTTIQRIVLFTMAVYVNSGEGKNRHEVGKAYPGHQRIITRWGMSKRAVTDAIAQLVGLGLIEITEHGYHGKYSRYQLAGDLIDPKEGSSTETLQKGCSTCTLQPEECRTCTLRVQEVHSKSAGGAPESRSHLRSHNGVDDDDDGANAPSSLRGSLGAAPTVVEQVRDKLGMSADEALKWIETCLGDRQISNVDAYLRTALANHLAGKERAAATRASAPKKVPAKKPAAKKAPAKKRAAKKASAKTAGKAQPSTPRLSSYGPSGYVCNYRMPGGGQCGSVRDIRISGPGPRCPDHTREAIAARRKESTTEGTAA